jgi:voltage-gated potassium channel
VTEESPGSRDEGRARRQARAERIHDALSLPTAILAVVWVVVIIIELVAATEGRHPSFVHKLSNALWAIFALEFLLELVIAPDRKAFLHKHWLTAVSVIVPGLSVFRGARALASVRGVLLSRSAFAATSAPRRIRRVFVDNRLGPVLVLFALVVLLGAAIIYYVERQDPEGQFKTFGFTVYWAACLATTVNFGAEPVSAIGRVTAFLLRICGVGFFGYVAGGLASHIFGVKITRGP